MAERELITVGRLADYLTRIVRGLEPLRGLAVVGELSNVKRYRSGHIYFTVKDADAQLNAVMYRGNVNELSFEPVDGQAVILSCRVDFYQRTGALQLIVQGMELEGTGRLYEAYERLRAKLEAEGLFAAERKRPLPSLPRHIGVVTSPSGAVIRDILHVLTRRNPHFHLDLAPALVQGPQAAATLVEALERLNRDGRAEVIIFGRGGGSIEDLWPFNEEVVARAVAASAIPVVSAVGHETDFTICDFVADLRAPTPSAAAELVMPDRRELLGRVAQAGERLEHGLWRRLELEQQRLQRLAGARSLADPLDLIRLRRERLARLTASPVLARPLTLVDRPLEQLDRLQRRLAHATLAGQAQAQRQLARLGAMLDAMSPLRVLGRGYQLTYNHERRALTSARDIEPGERFTLRFADGAIGARAETRTLFDQEDDREHGHTEG